MVEVSTSDVVVFQDGTVTPLTDLLFIFSGGGMRLKQEILRFIGIPLRFYMVIEDLIKNRYSNSCGWNSYDF
jgi:hypothetical protein